MSDPLKNMSQVELLKLQQVVLDRLGEEELLTKAGLPAAPKIVDLRKLEQDIETTLEASQPSGTGLASAIRGLRKDLNERFLPALEKLAGRARQDPAATPGENAGDNSSVAAQSPGAAHPASHAQQPAQSQQAGQVPSTASQDRSGRGSKQQQPPQGTP